MRRLWVQLALIFIATVLGTSILLTLIARASAVTPPRPNPQRAVSSPNGLQQQLIALYDKGVSLEDSVGVLLLVDAVTEGRHWSFRLEDEDGNVVFDNLGEGQRRDTLELDDYGTLIVLRRSPFFTPPETHSDDDPLSIFPIETINSLLVLVGGILGIGVAIAVALYLTNPLRQLRQGALEFGKRNFAYRVKARGSVEFQEVAEAMNEMAIELEESDRLRKNLVADIAHELRTPLSVLEGSTRAIIDDVYPLEKSEILHIYDQTRLLHRLVNDLHELTLADANRLPLNREPHDIRELVQGVVDIFKPVAESTNLQVDIKFEGDFQPVTIDEFRIKQVLHNLLVNALHHTPEHGRISVQTIGDDRGITLHVHDTGVGIPSVHLPYIFERFYRADPSRNRARGGTGLGLAISKAIIEAHGGTISADSSEERGTTFTIILPYGL